MKPAIGLSILLFIFAHFVWAQPFPLESLKNFKPRSIGPAAMSGRITAIAIHPDQPNTIYAGAAAGGVWKSDNGGVKWTPVFDEQTNQSIGALAISPKNPMVIWAGTGEGNPRNSLNTGNGIYKSLDGGKSWKSMGLSRTKTIHRILIHPDNPDIVFVGTLGSPWGPNPERGVYKTKDGGKSWNRILFINDSTGVADMVIDPTNPDKLIVAMWQYGRKPWTFNSGGPGSGIHVSFDGGDTWTLVSEKYGLPKGSLGRIGLAIAPGKPQIVYALIEAKTNGLYRSSDGGMHWSLVSERNIGDRPFYYAELYVDPRNENRIFNLYSSITRSEDGGKTFVPVSPGARAIHPDHHAFFIHPEDPSYMVLGNDGGLYISRDGGYHWQFMSGIPIGQFYHVNVDMDIPYQVYGGLQDNGTYVGPSAVWKNSGLRNAEWQEVFFGDGFDAMPRKDDNRYVFAMSQGGSLGYVDRLTGRSKSIRPVHPEGMNLRFNWNAALAQNPFADQGIYYGSQYLHKSMDLGSSWQIISPDLTTNNPEKQKQNESGGLTIDATGAENHCTIVAIAPSPLDDKVIWIGTDDGNVQLTRDGGNSWLNLTPKINGIPTGSWIPQIEVSRRNAGEAYVSVNNYRQNDWRPMVFATKDFGATWTRIVDEHKVNGYVWCIVQDPVVPELFFLGTDEGLFVSFDGAKEWQRWTHGYPAVPTSDLKIHPRDHDLVIATFGRAFYILDDIQPLREIARSKGSVLNNKLRLFPVPDAIQAQMRTYDGEHFGADGLYAGTNKATGAMLSVWIKEQDQVDSTAGRRSEVAREVSVRVYSESGENIRNLKINAEPGFNRFYWNLDRKGERMPSHDPGESGAGAGRFSRQDPNAEPGGIAISPGKYKIVVGYGSEKDSSWAVVLPDPRIKITEADRVAKVESVNKNLALVKAVTQTFDQLKEARRSITLVNEVMSNAPDSTKAKITALGKVHDQTIKKLMELFLTPTDFKGIDRSERLVGKLSRATQFINSSDGAPTPNGQLYIDQVTDEARQIIKQVNDFIKGDWADYQQAVRASNVSLFKP